ncbi:MAG: glycosyltransferase family 39 protein [Candidatus Hydrogenedentes bacterium]|nr:glycosyltransferase family 39 protein [Candidatus Hydrogenedentota bacterium]
MVNQEQGPENDSRATPPTEPPRHFFERWESWLLGGLLLFAALCRLYHITKPPIDFANWRETITLMLARNFLREGMNPFHPSVDLRTTSEVAAQGIVGGTEFPFVPFPTAALYALFGMHDWVGRVMPLLYALAGLCFFYGFVRRWGGSTTALVSTLLLSVSPMHLYFGRVHMPESFVFAASFATLYYYDRWLESEKRGLFWAAVVASALMLLGKPQLGVMAVPMALLTAQRWGWRMFTRREFYLFALLTALPFLAYFCYSYLWIIPRTGLSFASHEVFRFDLLTTSNFYRTIARTIWHIAVEPTVCVLSVVGLGVVLYERYRGSLTLRSFLPHAWLLGASMLLVIMPGGSYVNTYYLMILAPPACLLAGHLLATCFGHSLLRWGAAAALAVATLHGVHAAYKCFEPVNEAAYRCGNWVRKNTAPDALVLTSVENPATLYFCDRVGWICWRQNYGEVIVFNQALVERVHELGADVVAIPDGERFDNPSAPGHERYQPVRDYLNENFRAHRERGFVVFFLDDTPRT